jgi:hypothetical protein
MSKTITSDAYNIEKRDFRTGTHARELAGAFNEISGKISTPGFPLPDIQIPDLCRSQGSLEQNNLVANSTSGENASSLSSLPRSREQLLDSTITPQSNNSDLSEALSMLDKMRPGSSSFVTSSNSNNNPNIAAGL